MSRKLGEKGLIWCASRLFRIFWQRLPLDLRSFIINAASVITIILSLLGSWLLYLFGFRILVNCRTGGIGHLALEPFWFLIKKDAHKGKYRKKYILYIPFREEGIANDYMIELLKIYFIIFKSNKKNRIIASISRYDYTTIDIGITAPIGTTKNRAFTCERNIRHSKMMTDIQKYRYERGKRFFNISDEFLDKGRRNLEILGINNYDKFVCLHAGEISRNGRYAYDPFRRQDISSFSEVAEYITRKGSKVIRMGDKAVPEIPDTVPLIDYPHSRVKSDLMDLYLISECKYFIGCQTGLQSVAVIFGKPQILTNIIPWHWVIGFEGDIYLPKMIKSEKTGVFISLKEYLANELHFAQWELPEPFEAISNNAEDIINAVDEMELYLTNQKKLPEPCDLQILWKESFPPLSQCKYSAVRISASFIHRYKEILFSDLERDK